MSISNVLVAAPRCPRIFTGLRNVAAKFPGQVNMPPDAQLNGLTARGEAVRSASGLVLLDGHHNAPGVVDGLDLGPRGHLGIKAPILIVGSCWSGEPGFVDAVRKGLTRPVTYLGCDGVALYEHAELVFGPVLEALLAEGLPPSAAIAKATIDQALARIRDDHPRKTSLARWKACNLEPSKKDDQRKTS